MASADARPVPIKNIAFRVTFPIFDADGDLVAGATGLDSEVSLDGAAFGDCTNEATEIAASSGIYYLDLPQAEMNADTVVIIVKTSSSGAKTTPIILYPFMSNLPTKAELDASTMNIQASFGYDSATDTLTTVVDVKQNGVTIDVSTSVGVRFFNSAHSALWAEVACTKDETTKAWKMTKVTTSLVAASAYYARVAVVHNAVTYTANIPVTSWSTEAA